MKDFFLMQNRTHKTSTLIILVLLSLALSQQSCWQSVLCFARSLFPVFILTVVLPRLLLGIILCVILILFSLILLFSLIFVFYPAEFSPDEYCCHFTCRFISTSVCKMLLISHDIFVVFLSSHQQFLTIFKVL